MLRDRAYNASLRFDMQSPPRAQTSLRAFHSSERALAATAFKTEVCDKLTAVGFEPTPLRNGALSHRLRPLGQTVLTEAFDE